MNELWQGLKCGFEAGMLRNMFGGFIPFGGCMPFGGCNHRQFNFRPNFIVPTFMGNFYEYSQSTTLFMPDVDSINISPKSNVFDMFQPPEFTFNAGWDTYSFTAVNATNKTTKSASVKSKSTVAGGENAYDDLINKYSAQYGVEPELVKAVMKQESRFNPNAKSKKNAKGLMQLIPATAEQYGVTNPYDPEQSIRAGVQMLSELSKMYNGDKEKILAAYNWGCGNLNKEGLDKMPKETRNYIPAVLGYYNEYKSV